MNKQDNRPVSGEQRLAEFAVMCGMTVVILGGLWSLYMSDAPYHPGPTDMFAPMDVASG